MSNGLLQTIEKAPDEQNPAERKKLFKMEIAGGGPRGVELASMLCEFKLCLLNEDYPELKNKTLHIHLIEGSPYLLAPMSDISIQFDDKNYPNGHPQLAQPAIQQGKRLAKNLLLQARNSDMKPFKYFDKGDMAIMGRRWTVADLLKHHLHLHGFFGLLSWGFIHIISLLITTIKLRPYIVGWLLT